MKAWRYQSPVLCSSRYVFLSAFGRVVVLVSSIHANLQKDQNPVVQNYSSECLFFMLVILIERTSRSSGHSMVASLSCYDFFFLEHELDKAQNLKLLISTFGQMLGLIINFCKSELFYFGEINETVAK